MTSVTIPWAWSWHKCPTAFTIADGLCTWVQAVFLVCHYICCANNYAAEGHCRSVAIRLTQLLLNRFGVLLLFWLVQWSSELQVYIVIHISSLFFYFHITYMVVITLPLMLLTSMGRVHLCYPYGTQYDEAPGLFAYMWRWSSSYHTRLTSTRC